MRMQACGANPDHYVVDSDDLGPVPGEDSSGHWGDHDGVKSGVGADSESAGNNSRCTSDKYISTAYKVIEHVPATYFGAMENQDILIDTREQQHAFHTVECTPYLRKTIASQTYCNTVLMDSKLCDDTDSTDTEEMEERFDALKCDSCGQCRKFTANTYEDTLFPAHSSALDIKGMIRQDILAAYSCAHVPKYIESISGM